MPFVEKVFKRNEGIDIEEFLNNLDVEDETLYEEADAFVKPMNLNTNEDAATVVNEAKQGNIVLLNIGDLNKRNAIKLKELISDIKGQISEINGDMARISPERVLITPSRVKIIKMKTAR